MRFTYNWLKDFVDIKISPLELAKKLTMAGLEVTSLEQKNNDFVLEIEVTSNRPDCLSVIGLAREVAAITDSKLQIPSAKLKIPAGANKNGLKITVESKSDCPLYTARVIKNVKVRPSPNWLKERLESIGCRSINNAVDITNYILFTWGEPLHAFDFDKFGQKAGIIIRRGKNAEKVTTIDGVARDLNEDMLVIAAGQDLKSSEPVAVAGVMGGEDTEVTEGTHNILLEAAVFKPVLIRQGRQRLGINSESSYRFERGVDLSMVEKASFEATRLIQDICGGDLAAVKSTGSSFMRSKKITFNISTIEKIVGVSIKPSEIKKILNSLGFKIKNKGKNSLAVVIPSHRLDIEREIDLVEEIARVFGYDKVPASIAMVIPQAASGKSRDFVLSVKNILTGLGLNEVITYSLLDRGGLKEFPGEQKEPIEILNPLSKEQAVLRTTLMPGLASCVAYNLNQRQEYVNIFEVAKAYSLVDGKPKEETVLGIALCGIKYTWSEQGRIKEELGFLHLKGIVENFLARLGIEDYSIGSGRDDLHFQAYANNERIGLITKLKKVVLEKLDIKNKEVFIAELKLDKIAAHFKSGKKFSPLPLYPGINRDISLVIQEGIGIDKVTEFIKQEGGSLLKGIEAVDCYRGKQIPMGLKSLTLSVFYRSDERTLTEAEINPLHTRLKDALEKKFNAQIR